MYTYYVEMNHLAAGCVIRPRHLALILPAVQGAGVPHHQYELRPLLPHHGLHPAVQGVAHVVQGHQLGDWAGVAQP